MRTLNNSACYIAKSNIDFISWNGILLYGKIAKNSSNKPGNASKPKAREQKFLPLLKGFFSSKNVFNTTTAICQKIKYSIPLPLFERNSALLCAITTAIFGYFTIK